MLHDLITAAPYLGIVGAGVGLIVLGGLITPTDADQHDLGDYHEAAEPADEVLGARRLRPAGAGPAPAAGVVSVPVFDEMAARVYVPLDDEAVRALAAEWLEEFGAKARAELAAVS